MRIPRIHQSTLSNGIRVVSQPSKLSGASICLHVACGAQYDASQPAGISHLVEHMLFKGTTQRTAAELAAAFDAIGTWCNAYTDRMGVSYYLTALPEDIPDAFDLLADMYLNSTFPEVEFETEKGVIQDELRLHDDDNNSFLSKQFFQGYLKGHPLGTSVIGSSESVAAISRQQAVTYKQAQYTPARTIVSATGRVSHEAVVAMVEQKLGHLAQEPQVGRASIPIVPQVGIARHHQREMQQTLFYLGYPTIGAYDPKIWPATLLSQILGGGMGSRLFQEIRERQGLAYSVGSSVTQFCEGSIFFMFGSCDSEAAQEAVERCHDEALKLAQRTVTPEELKQCKRQMRSALLLDYDNHLNQAFTLATELGNFGFITPRREILVCLEAVSAASIMELAEEVFAGPAPRLETVGPKAGLSLPTAVL